jgi:hypothetical protein
LKRIRLPPAAASRGDDLRSAVEDERRKNGSSFGTAWNRVKATKPELFDNLDLQAKDLAELNEIEQGDSYTPHVEPMRQLATGEAGSLSQRITPRQRCRVVSRPTSGTL